MTIRQALQLKHIDTFTHKKGKNGADRNSTRPIYKNYCLARRVETIVKNVTRSDHPDLDAQKALIEYRINGHFSDSFGINGEVPQVPFKCISFCDNVKTLLDVKSLWIVNNKLKYVVVLIVHCKYKLYLLLCVAATVANLKLSSCQQI